MAHPVQHSVTQWPKIPDAIRRSTSGARTLEALPLLPPSSTRNPEHHLPGEQESRMLIPQETKSRPESPSSEKSTYDSCEDADDFEKNEDEKVSSVNVPHSDVQPGDQESSMLISQETKSRSESPSSEESMYDSCEDADDFERNEEENISTVDAPHSDVQPGDQESSLHIPQETKSQSESPSSEESTHYSCEDTDDFDDVSLTKEQKYSFFQILRGLLEEPNSLKNGKERKVRHDGKILKLMYMTERCEIIVQDSHGHIQFKGVVSTQDIYLRWSGDENAEPLSLENLQKVWKQLKLLKILNEKGDSCFSRAMNEFMKEFECVQKNTTLKLIYDAVMLTFVSGKGINVATVAYDDCKKKPKYQMKVIWWIIFWRFLHSGYGNICEFINSLINLCNTFTSCLNCILDWFHSWEKHQKMQ